MDKYSIYKVKISGKNSNGEPNFKAEKVEEKADCNRESDVDQTNPKEPLIEGDACNGSSAPSSESSTKPRSRVSKNESESSTPQTDILEDGDEGVDDDKKHFLINFFPFKYVLSVLFSLSWKMIFKGFSLLLLDVIRCNKFKSFIKFFIEEAVNSRGISGQYIDISEYAQPQICTALMLITEVIAAHQPALINCAHGKDRTGIISALILSCLGMSKEYIVADYAKSTEGLARVQRRIHQEICEHYNFREEFTTSRPNTMHCLLDHLALKYGSVSGYLTHIGFGPGEQARLAEALEVLPPGPAPDHAGADEDVQLGF